MTYKPGQKRGAAGTSLGGQFVGPKSIARALIKALSERGHGAAAKDLRQNPPHLSAPKKRAITRWSPSERELKGHTRASHDAAQLRGRIATLDEDLKAPQHDGGRMSHPAERRKAEMTRAELQRQLAELEPRVAAGDERRRQHPDMYGDAPHAGAGPDGSDAELASVEAKLAKLVAMPDHQKREAWWDEVDALQERQRAIKRGRELTSVQPHTPPAGTGIAPPTLAEFDDLNSLDIHQQHAYEDLRAQGVGHEQALQRARQQGPTATQATQPHPSPAGVGHQDSRAPVGQPEHVAPGAPALSSDPATRAAQVDNRLRAAYNDLPKAPGGWVGIADLRDAMGDVPRADQDAALTRLIDASLPGSPRIIPVANTKALKPRDRAAAIKIGMEDNHAVSFNNGHGGAPTVPVPGGAGPAPVVPGAAPKAPRKAAAKVAAARRSFDAAAIVSALQTAASEGDGRELVAKLGRSKADHQTVASLLGVEVSAKDSIPALREAILRQAVTRRLEHDAYLRRAQPVSASAPAPREAPGKAAAKVAAAKASAEPPHAIAARLHASTDETEARAMLSGLTVKQLNEVAAAAGLERQSGRKAEIVDKISYQTVGHRVDSAVLRTRGGSTSAAPLVGPSPLPAPAKSAAAKVKAANPDVRPDPMAEHMAVQRAAYEIKPFGEPEMPPAVAPKRKAAAKSAAAKVRAAKAPSVPTPVAAPAPTVDPNAPGMAEFGAPYTVFGGPNGTGKGFGSEPTGAAPSSPRRGVEVENTIRQEYAALAPRSGASRTVKLADLRARLDAAGFSREEVDNALLRMNRTNDVFLSPEAAQFRLTPRLRSGAIHTGGQDRHDIIIYDTSPRPLPDVPGTGR